MDASPRRGRLTYRTKNYRLSAETRHILEAIRRCQPHEYLTFDELLEDLAARYLRYNRTIAAAVRRYFREQGWDTTRLDEIVPPPKKD